MCISRVLFRAGGAVLTAWLIGALAGPMQAADDADAMRKQALALNEITGDEVVEARLKALIKDPAGTKKLLETAQTMAKEKDQPFNYTALKLLADAANELEQTETALGFFRLCTEQALKLRSGQKLAQSYGGLIDLLYSAKRYEEASKVCQEFVEIRGNETVDRLKPAVLERMIQSLARQGKNEEALKLVNRLVKAEEAEDGWWYLQLKGWVLREAGDTKEAATVYEDVLDRIGKDKSLKDEQKKRFAERTRYALSGIWVEAKDLQKAAEHLRILLKEKPDSPTYHNDLGYIWADHDQNLDEAEKMIRKAIDLDREQRKKNPDLTPAEDKDVAAYLDSLGWVLYKKKNYAEAKKYLSQAVEDKEGQHIEIYDHLGDVLMALGEKKEAIEIWKKGVASAQENKREQDRKVSVEKKIKDAK